MKDKKHILIISQYFFPESFRINDICQELVKRGYKITVLTGIPNYPDGKFFSGYNWFKKRREVWEGIEIIRIPIVSRGKSNIRLILNYYSFVVSGFFWNLFTKLNADMVFTFEVSPMIQAKIGIWYAQKHKVPNYLYVQDLWPDNLEIVGGIHNKVILAHYWKMSNKIYKNYTNILATSQSFVEEIENRMQKNAEKVVYWPQYAEDFYVPTKCRNVYEILNNEKFKIVFTGNIGYAQGLEILPKTALHLKDKGISDICFVIVGNGRYKEHLIAETCDLGVEKMFLFMERQPSDAIPNILSSCDVAFVSFMNNALFEKTIPAKLQSYMACGMPIIGSASGETERIINEANCGQCAQIGNVKELVQAIENIRNSDLKLMSCNSRNYYLKNFDKRILMDRLITLLESI
ncbi:MAG: glycosyltransferase family 4 protein [Clostridiales bacterium]|nr:glycosyltransferase family 4 protein [Candidatus Equinaster intestinalis]